MKRTVRRTPMPNREGLAAALGRVCQYPKLMMTGAAGGVVEILDCKLFAEGAASGRPQQVRMSGFYGALRGSPGTDIAAAIARAAGD